MPQVVRMVRDVARRSAVRVGVMAVMTALASPACGPSPGADLEVPETGGKGGMSGGPKRAGRGDVGGNEGPTQPGSAFDAGATAKPMNGAGNGSGVGSTRVVDAAAGDPGRGSDGGSAGPRPLVDGGSLHVPPAPDPIPGSAGPLPVIFIDTGGKVIPKTTGEMIPAKFKMIVAHDGKFDWKNLASFADKPVAVEQAIGISRHGNASDQFADQKAYNIEFRDEKGGDVSVPLLGMPKGSDWLLYACFIDRACMRNALAYDLARKMGHWAPRIRHVEVVVDGKYNGMYMLIEKIRRDDDRVDVPKVAMDATGDISGGYIWKIDSPLDGPGREWKSTAGILWQWVSPKWDVINPAQKQYLTGFLNAFDAVWDTDRFSEPGKGYRDWIDVRSFIDYELINELSNNGDGIWRSAFFHKSTQAKGNKIVAGPVWDYDLAFGTDLRMGQKTDVWQLDSVGKQVSTSWLPIFKLWKKLWNDAAFQSEMKCRWEQVNKTLFSVDAINKNLDGWTKDLADANKRHFQRWPIIGTKGFGFNYFTDKVWQDDVDLLKTWTAKRLEWINANLPGMCKP